MNKSVENSNTSGPSPKKQLNTPLKKRSIFLLKLFVTLFFLGLVYNKIEFKSLTSTLKSSSLKFVFMSILIVSGASWLQALRWKLILRKPKIKLIKFLHFIYLGFFFKAFMPGTMSGDIAKIYLFSKKYDESIFKSSFVFLSQILGIMIQWLIGIIGLLYYWDVFSKIDFFSLLEWDFKNISLLIILISLLIGAFFYLYPKIKNNDKLTSIKSDLKDFRLLSKIFIITLLIQLLAFLSAWFVLKSVNIHIEFMQLALVLAIINSFLVLPISIGGIGVSEYLSVLLFCQMLSFPRVGILSSIIIGYGIALFFALLGGIWLFFRKLQEKTS